MLKRKLVVALYSSLISVLIVGFPMAIGSKYEVFQPFIHVSFYIIPINFIIGVSTSILSDFSTARVLKYRAALACIIHIGVAIAFSFAFTFVVTQQLEVSIFTFTIFTIPSVICSSTFWIIDEILRRRKSIAN
jgi:hypothetical protein